MSRQLSDFFENLEWNRLAGETVQAVENVPIAQRMPSRYYQVNGSNVVIASVVSAGARGHWKTGGWASQIIDFSPSSTSVFPRGVLTKKYWLRMGFHTLCVFPKIAPNWTLEMSFPFWLPNVTIEAWRYDGSDFTEFDFLSSIEQKIDSLP